MIGTGRHGLMTRRDWRRQASRRGWVKARRFVRKSYPRRLRRYRGRAAAHMALRRDPRLGLDIAREIMRFIPFVRRYPVRRS
jgi:hypothetical protein